MDDQTGMQRWLVGMAVLVTVMTINALYKKFRKTRNELALVAWAKQNGFEIRFVEPPVGVMQQHDAALNAVIELNIPRLGSCIYNRTSLASDAMWRPDDLTVFLRPSARYAGKGSGAEESCFTLKTENSLPEGELVYNTIEDRGSAGGPCHRLGGVLSSNRYRSSDPENFARLLTDKVLEVLDECKCYGFQVKEGYVSIYFDGRWNPMTWDTNLPQAKKIVETLTNEI